ncbi:hypothetical protein HG535_0D04770 [Zygotorulaspora mrakii]|uniref:Protein-S-isoprenylcysteine O-methyltransferase n=1 Tax=Zygotorulaspora mrakii TaxID=42260 RepID=A0A7H9B284_ZYGMR|nr:uncharacterized protein HG535_0D04770 [Zygotorulaspora mrakii]QLG72768.1 hypothetical protein HG535_0D04770 [Zygotorulaspora mrakii]
MSRVTNSMDKSSADVNRYADISNNPLHTVTFTSFALGTVLGLFLGLIKVVKMKNLNAYIVFLCFFHFMEYFITAKYNPLKVNQDSFLLNNGSVYILCHLIATLEYVIEYIFYPNIKVTGHSKFRFSIIVAGYLCISAGQAIRSLAMSTAGKSFSHVLQTKKKKDHTLIQSGVYQWFRHPSYFGFFWWALGTQMILLNPVSFTLFAVVLWKFFHDRIKTEEIYLIKFFGDDYIKFKTCVPVRIPFIE